jgi:uncharacterized membrane protein
MTQKEFLAALEVELKKLNVKNPQDILNDYAEHFQHGLEGGKTEQEICDKLGSPSTIAKAFEAENLLSQVKASPSQWQPGLFFIALGKFIVLAPFNFLVLFIPGVVTFALLTAGWAVTVAMASVFCAAVAICFKVIFMIHLGFWSALAGTFGSVGFAGLTVLFAMIMYFITKSVFMALVSYLKWNLDFILAK